MYFLSVDTFESILIYQLIILSPSRPQTIIINISLGRKVRYEYRNKWWNSMFS